MLMMLLSLPKFHIVYSISPLSLLYAKKLLSAEAVWHFEAISQRLLRPSLHLLAMKTYTLKPHTLKQAEETHNP